MPASGASHRQLSAMTDQLRGLVEVESPSDDLDALERCAVAISGLAEEAVGEPAEIFEVDGRPHLRLGPTSPRVMLLGHFDTVWPLGTLASMPCVREDGLLHGPGAFDMKAGIVLALHALGSLEDRRDVGLLLTSDEEIGSQSSRELVVRMAESADAVLVLEPSGPGGALKVGRKGVASYRVRIEGRAAHAGLEPERGVNAVLEAAHEILEAAELATPDAGTTVAPTVVAGGSVVNVVPELAILEIDVRAQSVSELERVDAALRSRRVRSDVRRELEQLSSRPPLEPAMSEALFERAAAVADALGLPPVERLVVGGGSDGNFTAAAGTPTLDGLGAIGDGAHAPDERVEIEALAQRLDLVRGLVESLLAEPL